MKAARGKYPPSRKSPKVELLLVEWVDSHSTSSWNIVSDLPRDPLTCFTVGWIVREDEMELQLAGSVSVADTKGSEFNQVSGVMSIPKVSILRRKVLTRGGI